MSSFKKLNYAHAICDDGFEVKFNRNALTYKSDSIVISFEIEHGLGEMDIYSEHYTVHKGEDLDISYLLVSIGEALDFLSVKYRIDWAYNPSLKLDRANGGVFKKGYIKYKLLSFESGIG